MFRDRTRDRGGHRLNISVGANFRARLQHWFPDREFFMRSQGHVRFIKVSSRV